VKVYEGNMRTSVSNTTFFYFLFFKFPKSSQFLSFEKLCEKEIKIIVKEVEILRSYKKKR
jgi:hypothetical protein